MLKCRGVPRTFLESFKFFYVLFYKNPSQKSFLHIFPCSANYWFLIPHAFFIFPSEYKDFLKILLWVKIFKTYPTGTNQRVMLHFKQLSCVEERMCAGVSIHREAEVYMTLL